VSALPAILAAFLAYSPVVSASAETTLVASATGGAEDQLVPPALPAERRPVRAGESSLWRLRLGLGGSTMRLGGLEHFPDASIGRTVGNWAQAFGIRSGPTERHNVDFALIESAEASFQVDPLVSVAMKFASLRSERGSLRTIAESATMRFEDTWEFSADMVLVMAGAGFNLPLAEHLRLNVGLFLGAGFATVELDHRYRSTFGTVTQVSEGTAEGTGNAFIPEFTMELEHDLSDSLSLGAGLGYRFGGVDTIESRYGTTLDPQSSAYPEFEAGWPVRNSLLAPLTADYGGLILVLFFTARG